MVDVEVSVQACCPLPDASEYESISPETWQDWFGRWLQDLQAELPSASTYELGFRLTDDAEIRSLNGQYRQTDRATDVLAFATLEVECPHVEGVPIYLGDIVISVETALRQAKERQHSPVTELGWLATHGLLHLLGWDHPDEPSLQQMLDRQETLLELVGLSL
jgi:probable rRNA maturation factor